MTIEIRVPVLGESISEATVGKWLRKAGDAVGADEPLVELETDKVTVEVPAPAAGVLAEIKVEPVATVPIGAVLALLKEGAAKAATAPAAAARPEKAAEPSSPAAKPGTAAASKPAPAPRKDAPPPSPAARKALAEAGLEAERVEGSGRRGQVLKEDVAAASRTAAQIAAVEASEAANNDNVPGAADEAPPRPAARTMAPVPVPSQPLRVPAALSDAPRE